MDPELPAQDKNSFLRNDRLLVCSMLAIYGLCIVGAMGALIWGLDRRNKEISTNVTSTAVALVTQQANATATITARLAEQAQYDFVDSFNNNKQNWEMDSINDDYMSGSISIKEGAYVWEVQNVKKTFIFWEDFPAARWVGDFDVYVDSKVKAVDGTDSSACSGFVFREGPSDWESGAYVFSVCNSSRFYVEYYGQGKWEDLSGSIYSSAIQSSEWNRLEISARGNQFTFIVNHEIVFEMADDRLPKGGLALYADVNEEKPVTIWFDNFGFQPH